MGSSGLSNLRKYAHLERREWEKVRGDENDLIHQHFNIFGSLVG